MSQNGVYIIGNFDGVHRGHHVLIEEALRAARHHPEHPLTVALTFWPHPRAILRPDQPLELLQTQAERAQRFRELKVDEVVTVPFTRDLSDMSWEEFIKAVLLQQPIRPIGVFVGADFQFGKGRSGTAAMMKEYLAARNVEVHIVPKAVQDGSEISSSRIRELLRSGKVEEAHELLGYPYALEGLVEHGEGRGKKLGAPTGNLHIESLGFGKKMTPAHGVYVTRTFVDGKGYSSVTNVGVQPTFETATPQLRIETHLLDEKIDLYGRTIRVEFHHHIREEKKFPSPEALAKQISEDVQIAKNFWAQARKLSRKKK